MASWYGPELNTVALYLAAFYHDAIYSTEPGATNETDSAELAGTELDELGITAATSRFAQELIVETEHHQPTSPESVLLTSADVGILAAARDTYIAYAANTRAEYGQYTDEQWIRGRTAALEGLRHRRLFPDGDPRQDAADANIDFELSQLATHNIL